jgi:hypothetical protein
MISGLGTKVSYTLYEGPHHGLNMSHEVKRSGLPDYSSSSYSAILPAKSRKTPSDSDKFFII